MEMQSLGVLPIATDMRTIEHLTYTPAPDIVHEAAGHAPILIDPEFSAYLQKYAQVARKSILNDHDLEVYESIRELSDLKEDPAATPDQIKASYARLEKTKEHAGDPSEAALLARMNWWTAEYGLIGDVDHPKIYGAGLMSSVGESRTCLQSSTRKIPFSLQCLNFNYDITEPQPQVFVTPNFETLSAALENLADTMAFRRGGHEAVEKIIRAKTVNTVQLDSGIQISGKCAHVHSDHAARPLSIAFIKFEGPCQLSFEDRQLSAHGLTHDSKRHAHGFSSPIGLWKNPKTGAALNPVTLSESNLKNLGFNVGHTVQVETTAGVNFKGKIKSFVHRNDKLILITFENCTVRMGTDILFQPEWGDYDMVIGTHIPSVFGGPADRENYGETEKFAVASVKVKPPSPHQKELHTLYAEVRAIRTAALDGTHAPAQKARVSEILAKLEENFSQDWLLRLEILELAHFLKLDFTSKLEDILRHEAETHASFRDSILDGLKIANQIQLD